MHAPAWVFYALLTVLLWGVGSITQKLATNWISTELSFVWFACAMITIALVILPVAHIDWHMNSRIFWLAVAGGALNGLGALTSFAALERGGKASIVIPLCYLYPIITIILAIVLLHETLTRSEAAGIVLAIAAALLLSREGPLNDQQYGQPPQPKV